MGGYDRALWHKYWYSRAAGLTFAGIGVLYFVMVRRLMMMMMMMMMVKRFRSRFRDSEEG